MPNEFGEIASSIRVTKADECNQSVVKAVFPVLKLKKAIALVTLFTHRNEILSNSVLEVLTGVRSKIDSIRAVLRWDILPITILYLSQLYDRSSFRIGAQYIKAQCFSRFELGIMVQLGEPMVGGRPLQTINRQASILLPPVQITGDCYVCLQETQLPMDRNGRDILPCMRLGMDIKINKEHKL